MVALQKLAPLVVVIGETASGKTALAIELAKKFNGEIIAADSRTVYKGMDVGTAKPSKEEQEDIQHHLIDVVEPDQTFTAAQFKKLATQAIEDIHKRGRLPIMAGGSGLYINSVIFNYQFNSPPDPKERQRLEDLSVEKLQQEIEVRGLPMPQNSNNPRHLIRAIETGGKKPTDQKLRPNTLIIGVIKDREQLKKRIAQRVDDMIRQGLIGETRELTSKYGWRSEAIRSTSYKAFSKYVEGQATLEEAKEEFVKNDLNLAKRQRTWFNRNKSIQWVSDKSEAVDLVTTFLNN